MLAESVAGLGEKYPDLVVHQRLETNTEPAKALVEIAAGARLLVIGSHGRWRVLPVGARLHGPRCAAERAVPHHRHPGA